MPTKTWACHPRVNPAALQCEFEVSTMAFQFTKMHGLGNDYVYIDLFNQQFEADWPALARKVSDRHFGIGADGLILICPSNVAPVGMRIFNADGSEAEMCGNGLRCTVKYAYEHGLLDDARRDLPSELAAAMRHLPCPTDKWQSVRVETAAGVLTVAAHTTQENTVDLVCVDMGRPILKPTKIPVDLPGKSVVGHPLVVGPEHLRMTCLSMGNPHAVIFTDRIDTAELDRLGPIIEHHQLFPNRTNVHFAQTSGTDRVSIITWERGSGRTLACGTGACAVCVAGVLERRLDRAVTAELPGGQLKILWNSDDDHVYMLGEAAEVFTGTWRGQGGQ